MPVSITRDQIGDIYRGYAYDWTVNITVAGAAPDIRLDTVSLIIKKQVEHGETDADAVLTKSADVATAGLGGIATFNLSAANTEIPSGLYYLEIKWLHAGKPVRLLGKQISVLDPAFNVTV